MIIRKINKDDIDFFYEIKSNPFNMYWSGWNKKPIRENIEKFVMESIEKENDINFRKIFIVEDDNGNSCGYMYLIPNGNEFDIPVAIMPGISNIKAKDIIKEGLIIGKKLGFKKMKGAIREDNYFSMKAYKSNGIIITEDYYESFVESENKVMKFYITYKNV